MRSATGDQHQIVSLAKRSNSAPRAAAVLPEVDVVRHLQRLVVPPADLHAAAAEQFAAVVRGELRVAAHEVLPLEQAELAHQKMGSGTEEVVLAVR